MFFKFDFCPETQPRLDLLFLKHFTTSKAKNSKPPKKEYLRCKLIRGHKRAIRQLTKGVIPLATLHKFDINNTRALRIWERMRKIYDDNRCFFTEISKTEAGPNTDGKSKRQGDPDDNQKSFNLKFCQDYFLQECVRESFYFYALLIYSDFDINILIEKLQYFCCKENEHTIKCIEKWIMLREYITIYMFQELQLRPYREYTELISFPDYRKFIKIEDNINDIQVKRGYIEEIMFSNILNASKNGCKEDNTRCTKFKGKKGK
ncbi:hypothetical protein SteCoe_10895 [Stentor coeruleus]|uniref:Uncharacterized protein n=1 Tax=Stentor coeruleus TaxID=5963 RepID=A0A1R2CED9_9CILI|nr:hypothetical protein SteCoe_10895 [Stentor coeruleus]